MKFTLAAILSTVATAVFAQTAAPATGGIAINAPGLGVSLTKMIYVV